MMAGEAVLTTDIYRGRDPRLVPIYSVADVAHHLRVPRSTVQAWVKSREGPAPALGPIIERYLERIERDEEGLLRRLFPFVDSNDTRRIVAIDPRRKFGRPYLVDAGVETSVIAGRRRAGESIATLAADFDTTKDCIEGALRFENALQKAA